jgi:hypothetical protein
MRKMLLLVSVTAGALSMASFSPAYAFLSNQGQVAMVQAAQSDVMLVKRSKAKPRPPGWSRGKAAWKRGGRGVPPGQR